MNEVTAIATIAVDHDGFTAREFMQIADSGVFEGKVELVDGVIVKMAPAGLQHSLQNASITFSLMKVVEELRFKVGTDLAIEIDNRTIRGIDIALIRADAPPEGVAEGRDILLAIEIADSTLAKDLGARSSEYAHASIPVYWVVDVKAGVVHVMAELLQGQYGKRSVVRFGEPLAVPSTEKTMTIR